MEGGLGRWRSGPGRKGSLQEAVPYRQNVFTGRGKVKRQCRQRAFVGRLMACQGLEPDKLGTVLRGSRGRMRGLGQLRRAWSAMVSRGRELQAPKGRFSWGSNVLRGCLRGVSAGVEGGHASGAGPCRGQSRAAKAAMPQAAGLLSLGLRLEVEGCLNCWG